MKNSKKGFIAPLLIAIIAVLAVGGSAYYFSYKDSSIKNTSSNNQDTSKDIEINLAQTRDFLPNTIAKIDLNAKKFTLIPEQHLSGQEFQVTDQTVIRRGDKTISLADLTVGQDVYVRGISIDKDKNIALLVYVTNDFHTEKILVDSVNTNGIITAMVLLPPQHRNEKINIITTSDTIIKKGSGELRENRPIVSFGSLAKGDVATVIEIGTDIHPVIDQGPFVAVSVDVINPYFCTYDGLTLKTPGCIENNQNSSNSNEVQPKIDLGNGFTYTFLDTYKNAKTALANNGWETFTPQDFTSANDPKFPEIGWCGSGIDAICNVNFKKGNNTAHLNVQKGGRKGYTEWTVVGNE